MTKFGSVCLSHWFVHACTLTQFCLPIEEDAHRILQRDVELFVPGDLHCLLIIVSNPLGGLIAVAGVSVL